MEPIRVNINPAREGCYYELDPSARARVRAVNPEMRVAPMVFVGYERREDFEALQAPLWPSIGQVLTGLSWDRIVALGGLQLYDVTAHERVRDLPDRDAA